MGEPQAQSQPAQVLVVGVAEMKLSNRSGDRVVTHALGSCIGIAIHDPRACVGGILHYMLPLSEVNPAKAERFPYMFADSGIPAFLRAAAELGAQPQHVRVVMAGGAQLIDSSDFFAIGKRNLTMARKLLWKSRLLVDKEHVGGTCSRTLTLEIGSGRTWLKVQGREIEL